MGQHHYRNTSRSQSAYAQGSFPKKHKKDTKRTVYYISVRGRVIQSARLEHERPVGHGEVEQIFSKLCQGRSSAAVCSESTDLVSVGISIGIRRMNRDIC